MAEHDVRTLAELELLVTVYGQFPEPFLLQFPITVHVLGVDSVANSLPMYAVLKNAVDRYGWACPNLLRLEDLAWLADTLEVIRDQLLPLAYDFPDDEQVQALVFYFGFYVREVGMRVDLAPIRTQANTLGHRLTFTAQHRAVWDADRILGKIFAHYGEALTLLARLVNLA